MSGDHYFSEQPSSAHRTSDVSFSLPRGEVTVTTASGTFSPGGLDRGTAVLLDNVPPPSGRVLADVGCGWGPIALTLADSSPDSRVIAVDINPRAREVCAANARQLGLDNIEVLAPDEVPDDLTVDLIWSNPPIRIGKDALHELLGTWLRRLSETGEAWLVVAKNLGAESLMAWLNQLDQGAFSARRAARDKGFWVIEVRRAG